MPELPEVETLVLEFQKKLAGRTVTAVSVFRKTRVFKVPAEVFQKGLPGKRIEEVRRRGKFLVFKLNRESFLAFHLGMTGRLVWAAKAGSGDPHLHLGLQFEGIPGQLFFRDIRRFGGIYFWTEGETAPAGILRLGEDALKISSGEFKKIFKSRKGRIKSLLLDQKLVSGLGNIYADESLFRSGVDPRRRPFKIPGAKFEALHGAIREVLKEAIRFGGSSIDDYVRSDGSRGGFQERHRVYGKAGRACGNCGTLIRRIVLGGRSSFFCSKCQQ